MRRLVAPLILAALLGASTTARAEVDEWQAHYDPPAATRRSGLAGGLGLGIGLGSAAGYPNEARHLGNPDFRQDTTLSPASNGALWLGAALRDWFTFGLGLRSAAVQGQQSLTAPGGAFIVHIETFPLFQQGGAWRDVGLFADFGMGAQHIEDGEENVVAGGELMSVIGAGVFYEPLRLGRHFALGPLVEYVHAFGQTMKSHAVVVGLRTAFHTGP